MKKVYHVVDNVVNLLEDCVEHPESFLEPQPNKGKEFKNLAKVLYNAAKKLKDVTPQNRSKYLPKLLIEGYDNEQVWQQIALKNAVSIRKEDIEMIVDPHSLENKTMSHKPEEENFPEDSHSNSESDPEFENLDDIDEMENLSEDSLGNSEFKAMLKDSDNEMESEIDEEENFPEDSLGRADSESGPESEKMSENPLEKVEAEPRTAFEKQQEKEKQHMRMLEDSLLQPKPWQLTGEVVAAKRPENSLMKQPTIFDSNITPNIPTEELTVKVEEIVKMAITNKAWNDVERKTKPKGNPNAYYRKIELDQTKSKKGLAEIYEEDYLKLKHKPEEKEDPKHIEIKKLMDVLVPELNALFAFIPKPPVPDIKVVSNLPAVTVEDVAPISMSDAARLAPEEVKRKADTVFKSKTERSETDKKRERRKKKLYQKEKQKKMDDKTRELSTTNPAIAKKYEKLAALKKLKQQKNAHVVKEKESEKIKSSKDFFSRLQDEVQGKVSRLRKEKSKKLPGQSRS